MYRQALAKTPKEVLNWRLFFAVFVFGLLGAARGLDEGIIGTTVKQPSFVAEFGLKSKSLDATAQANRLSNITSMVQLGSIGGALVAFWINDKLGRLWATRELCIVWIIGTIIFLTSEGNLGQLYAGRLIMGLGIGQTTVVAPTYLAEMAPKAIRGLCTCMFAGSVYLGIMLGYFASYGTNLHISNTSATQWIIPNSLHLIFAGSIFLMTFFAIESPRWLVKVGQDEKASAALCKLRKQSIEDTYLQAELIDITSSVEQERSSHANSNVLTLFTELWTSKANLYRMFLGCFAQLLGQWSGANSITIYAPQYFAIVGVTGTEEGLLATAVFGVVKFVSALLCAFFLVDFIGRKRALCTGITLQFISILYIAIFLWVDSGAAKGAKQSASQKHAATGAIAMIYISGFGWAMGWNSIQYLINAEIFPLRLRSIGTSFVMMLHFANQYGNTKAVPEMFISMSYGGTLTFFAAVTLIGLAWVIFFVPELAGRSLESIDEIFNLPWHLIGLKGYKLTEGKGGFSEELDAAAVKGDEEKAEVIRHELAEKERQGSISRPA